MLKYAFSSMPRISANDMICAARRASACTHAATFQPTRADGNFTMPDDMPARQWPTFIFHGESRHAMLRISRQMQRCHRNTTMQEKYPRLSFLAGLAKEREKRASTIFLFSRLRAIPAHIAFSLSPLGASLTAFFWRCRRSEGHATPSIVMPSFDHRSRFLSS